MPSLSLESINITINLVTDILRDAHGEQFLYMPEKEHYSRVQLEAAKLIKVYCHCVVVETDWCGAVAAGCTAAAYANVMSGYLHSTVSPSLKDCDVIIKRYVTMPPCRLVDKYRKSPCDKSNDWFQHFIMDILTKYASFKALAAVTKLRLHVEECNSAKSEPTNHICHFLQRRADYMLFLCHMHGKVQLKMTESGLLGSSAIRYILELMRAICSAMDFTPELFEQCKRVFERLEATQPDTFLCANSLLLGLAIVDFAIKNSGDPEHDHSPMDSVFWGLGKYTIEEIQDIQDKTNMGTGKPFVMVTVKRVPDVLHDRANRHRLRKEMVADPKNYSLERMSAWRMWAVDRIEKGLHKDANEIDLNPFAPVFPSEDNGSKKNSNQGSIKKSTF